MLYFELLDWKIISLKQGPLSSLGSKDLGVLHCMRASSSEEVSSERVVRVRLVKTFTPTQGTCSYYLVCLLSLTSTCFNPPNAEIDEIISANVSKLPFSLIENAEPAIKSLSLSSAVAMAVSHTKAYLVIELRCPELPNSRQSLFSPQHLLGASRRISSRAELKPRWSKTDHSSVDIKRVDLEFKNRNCRLCSAQKVFLALHIKR
ncbi:hypothetical protein QQF64_012465 [Cirrhinus molitorella]|uniref:Uncharacterized protein n=1 Tax=Cirrhinus molitorella TaxID=172907 RepID=A0ABR3LWP4_9TELE